MIESRGKVTVETKSPEPDDPQVTLVITAPKSEWERVRNDLESFADNGSHVSYDFYSALDNIVEAI